MKNNSYLLVILMLMSLIVNSQENILSMRVLNKEILKNRDELIEVEIENLSHKTVLLPLSTQSLDSYEYMNGYEKIITESGSVNQISIGLRVVDSIGVFLTQVPSKGSEKNITHKDGIFNEIDQKTKEYRCRLLKKVYKDKGVIDEQIKIVEYDFLRKNLISIEPKEKIKINYILNLTRFSIHSFDESPMILPFEGGFDVKDNGCLFYLELDLEKSFLNPYYIKLREKKIINNQGDIFYGKLVSNKISILIH